MNSDIVVVGAGVIGLTCAWHLADAGMQVTVVDPAPAQGAVWAAAGMLAPVTELHYGEEALLALNLAAQARWPDHAGRLNDTVGDIGYRECGSALVARDADDAAELRRLLAVQQELGMQVAWLRSRELRALEPALAPSVRGGIRVDGDHQVDNRALAEALVKICSNHPHIRMIREPARAVQRSGRQAEGVALADDRTVDAPLTLIAAGARSGAIDGVELPLPIRPVKGQLLHLHNLDGPLATRNLRGEDCYIVSRPDGRIVIGATMEEQGFDDRPTAGAVRDLLHAGWELLPGIAEASFVETAVGFRPGSPDNAPVLGPHPDLDGLLLATGHHRNGVLQSALTAEAITAWATDRTVPDVVLPFGVEDRQVGAR